MGNSLQDQLLKAGLVSEQKARQVKTGKRKQKRNGQPAAQDAQAAARVAAEKRERDRELNRKRDEEAKRKAEEIALWQLVRDNRIARDGGDRAYNFTDGNKLKRLHVTAQQHQQLVKGQLGIVRHDDFYALVPAAIAERVAEKDPSQILVLNRDEEPVDEEYADYKIPDDLMW